MWCIVIFVGYEIAQLIAEVLLGLEIRIFE
jgi:hypothetical protein